MESSSIIKFKELIPTAAKPSTVQVTPLIAVPGPKGATGATGVTGATGPTGPAAGAPAALGEWGYFNLSNVGQGPSGKVTDTPSDLKLENNIQYSIVMTNNTTLAQLSDLVLGPASVVTQVSSTSINTQLGANGVSNGDIGKSVSSGMYRIFFLFDTTIWGEPFNSLYARLTYLSGSNIVSQPATLFQEIEVAADGKAYWSTEVQAGLSGMGTLTLLFV